MAEILESLFGVGPRRDFGFTRFKSTRTFGQELYVPRWVEFIDTRTIEQDGSIDVLITWGFPNLAAKISHATYPKFDVYHGVFKTDT